MSEKLFALIPSRAQRRMAFRNQVVEYESGIEQRNRVWSNPRFRFDLEYDILSDTDVGSVQAFYAEHGGNFESFLWQPPVPVRQESGQVLGKGNGSRVLFKVYGDRVSSIAAFIAGVDISAGSATGVSASLSNGTVTFATAPSSGQLVTANVQSERFAVRFDQDESNAEYFINRLVRNHRIVLVQDKVLP